MSDNNIGKQIYQSGPSVEDEEAVAFLTLVKLTEIFDFYHIFHFLSFDKRSLMTPSCCVLFVVLFNGEELAPPAVYLHQPMKNHTTAADENEHLVVLFV